MLTRFVLKNYIHISVQKDLNVLLDEDGLPFYPACFYLWHLKCVRHTTDNTCKAQALQLKQFLNFLLKYNIRLKNVNTVVVQKYLYGFLFKKKGLKQATILIHSKTISAFITFCIERCFIDDIDIDFHVCEGDINSNINQKSYSDSALEIKELYINEASLKLLTEYVSGTSDYIKLRNKLVLMLGYYAGLRTSDIASNPLLTIGSMREKIPDMYNTVGESLPTILGFTYNNKKSKKIVSLIIGPELIRAIHDFIYNTKFSNKLRQDSNIIAKLDGSPIIDDQIGTRIFKAAAENLIKSGILSDNKCVLWRKRHFHVLRKCFATNAVTLCRKQGLPPSIIVRDYLGHSDFKTSLKHYIIADWLINEHDDKSFLHFLSADETSLGRKYINKRESEQ